MPHGHQGILQKCTPGVMGMHVARGHDWCAHVVGQRLKATRQRLRPPGGGPLHLNPHVARPEYADKTPERLACIGVPACCEQPGYEPMACTPGEAHKAMVMGLKGLHGQQGVTGPSIARRSRVRVRDGDEPAEIGVPLSTLTEKRYMKNT